MKILHLPSTFFPRYTGGKEVFTYQLIKNTPQIDHRVVYHSDHDQGDTTYDGVSIRVLPPPVTNDYYRSYWELTYDALPGFRKTLDEFRPDLVHFHDFCAGASLSHLRICLESGIKTLVTYHSPGNTCMQKGLIRANKVPCDGEIIDQRCTSCRYRIKGVPDVLASTLAHLSPPIDRRGKVFLRNSTKRFHTSFVEFFSNVDAIQVHASWVKQVLLRNKVSPSKVHMVTFGGATSLPKTAWATANTERPLKFVLLGRSVNIKGAHVLLDAISLLPPSANFEVHFLGPYWDESPYGRQMQDRAKGDKRILPPRLVPPEKVLDELKKMDVCVIPSLWPETGPLSLLDAFAAGVPVIGTNHAGIAERVQHGKNGLLFKWNDSKDLAAQLTLVLNDRSILNRFKEAIMPNHTFAQMASEIRQLYTRIVVDRK